MAEKNPLPIVLSSSAFLSFIESDDINFPAGLSTAPGFKNSMQVKQGFNPLDERVKILTLKYFTDKRPSRQESILCGGECC